jgi:cytochrome c oxidase cbb3-type subunit 3
MTVRALRLWTVGLLGVGFLAFRPAASEPALAIEPTRAGVAKDATPQEVFRRRCVECHDNDGRGESMRAEFPRIPDFTDRPWQTSRSDAELAHSILEGRAKAMPRMKNKLGSVDVSRMVAFVRAFTGGKQVVADEPEPDGQERASAPAGASAEKEIATQGMRLFARLCTRCHGPDGRGSDMRESLPSIPDFTHRAWQEGRSDPQILASVLGGKGTGMPSFRNRLDPEQARNLLAFIRALAPVGTGSAATATATDDFEARFEQLRHEVEDLARQFHALSEPPRQP